MPDTWFYRLNIGLNIVIIIRLAIRLMARLPRFLDRALMEAAILWGWQGGLTLSTSQLGPKKGKSTGHVTPGWVWFSL